MFIKFNAQHFADAGTLANATIGYVNSYTGAVQAFAGKNTLNPTLKEYYDTELLENARPQMVFAQFAKKQPLPANRGRTVEWRKWNTFDKAGKLKEGVIPTGQKFGMTAVKGTIDQYGTYTTVTDVLELHGFDDTILGATTEMGASAAETSEVLIRNDLLTGTNVLYCDNVDTTHDNAYVSTPTNNFEMRNQSTARSLLTPTMINKARTKLVKDKAVPYKGKFFAIVNPSVAFDLSENKDWIDYRKYTDPSDIFYGEIGELHGVRFIESNYAAVLVGPNVATATRTATVASYSAAAVAGTDLTDSGDAGVTSSYAITISETPSAALVGHDIFILGTNQTNEATATNKDIVGVVGVDASAKIIYVDGAPATAPVQNDIIAPGDGGREVKGGAQNAAYATMFFGQESFGIIDPAEGGLEMIVHDKSEIGGPLNQFSTIGYKFESNGADILYPERLLRVMSCASASDTDVGNID